MANADFSQNRAQTPGGFDADSYRETETAETAAPLSPFQQKLAALEKKLPAAMQQRAAALALCVAVMLVGWFGFGSAKLRAKYNEAKSWYSAGLAADGGYTLEEELIARENAAASTITAAKKLDGLGADSAEVQAAQVALDTFASVRAEAEDSGSLHEVYEANEALGSAIDTLYSKMREVAADPMNPGGQYGQFTSAQTIINNLSYNDAVETYDKETGGFPASVLKGLSGVKKVELFA